MQALASLFATMAHGVLRLEQEQNAKDAAAVSEKEGAAAPAKRRRSEAELQRRTRRCTIRMANLGSRCYWMSTTEVATYILTGGDLLQHHHAH